MAFCTAGYYRYICSIGSNRRYLHFLNKDKNILVNKISLSVYFIYYLVLYYYMFDVYHILCLMGVYIAYIYLLYLIQD